MDPVRLAYLQLHFSVFLWGFTAVLGRVISLAELPLVWYRIAITVVSLIILPGVLKKVRQMPAPELRRLAGIGCLVSLHWVCFYGSIKYSNITVSLSCLATTSFFVALLEPLFLGRKVKPFELMLGLLVVPGIYMIYRFTEFSAAGITLGLLAAFLGATFTTLNKIMVENIEPRSMTFVELGSGLIFLSLLMPLYLYLFPEVSLVPSIPDRAYLVLLALGCTTLPFILSLQALRHISAFASTLTVNLEPVYGIIMAIIFFKENKELNTLAYGGIAVILVAVFLHPLLKTRFDRELPVH